MPGIDQCIDQIREDKLVRSLPGEIDTMLAWRAGGRLLIGASALLCLNR